MPNIIVKRIPEEGEKFNVRTHLLSKVGSCFSLLFNGVRVGVARVVENHHDNEFFHRAVHGDGDDEGGGIRNLAHHVYGVQVERIFGDDEQDN